MIKTLAFVIKMALYNIKNESYKSIEIFLCMRKLLHVKYFHEIYNKDICCLEFFFMNNRVISYNNSQSNSEFLSEFHSRTLQ